MANKHAALRRAQTTKKYGFVPDQLITDDLRSYGSRRHDVLSARHGAGEVEEQPRREFASADPTQELKCSVSRAQAQRKDFCQLTLRLQRLQ